MLITLMALMISSAQAQNTSISYQDTEIHCTDPNDSATSVAVIQVHTENGESEVRLNSAVGTYVYTKNAILTVESIDLNNQQLLLNLKRQESAYRGFLYIQGRALVANDVRVGDPSEYKKDPPYVLSPVVCTVTSQSGHYDHSAAHQPRNPG